MNYLLAINPVVAPLPKGLSRLGQCLANTVITYLVNKAAAGPVFRLQTAALKKLVTSLLMGVSGLQWIRPEQPVLWLYAHVGVILPFFDGLNLQGLLKVGPQALIPG